MAMIKCKECNEEISDKAEKCPKCGAPVVHKVLLSYPGQDDYRCTKCDYHRTIPQKAMSIEAPR